MPSPPSPLVPALLVALMAAACAGPAPRGPGPRVPPPPDAEAPPVRTIELEPLRIDVVRPAAGPARAVVYDARELLDEGNDLLLQRRLDEALASFDHLVRDFPDSPLVTAALYNAGLALEARRDFEAAAERYRQLLARLPVESPDHRDAQFRLGAVLAELQRPAEAAPLFEALLARTDLTDEDRVEATARLGYAQVELADYERAETTLRMALAHHRTTSAMRETESASFAAMAQFYLAAIPHRKFSALPLRLPEEQLAQDLDAKSEHVLLARDRYLKVVELKDAYWATAAVFQIGAMHQEFWDAFMAVPVPPDLNPDEAAAYVELLNQDEKVRSLLEKAIQYHERNLSLAERAQVQTPWVDASRAEATRLKAILARVDAHHYVVPGSAPELSPAELAPAPGGGDAARPDPSEWVPPRAEL